MQIMESEQVYFAAYSYQAKCKVWSQLEYNFRLLVLESFSWEKQKKALKMSWKELWPTLNPVRTTDLPHRLHTTLLHPVLKFQIPHSIRERWQGLPLQISPHGVISRLRVKWCTGSWWIDFLFMGLVIYRDPKQKRQDVYYFQPTLQYNDSVPKLTYMNFRQDIADGLG
jgi:hypothetical protein